MLAYEYVKEWKTPRYEIVDEQSISYPEEMVFILIKDRRKERYNFYITFQNDEYLIFEDSSKEKIWVFIKTHERECFDLAKEFYPWLSKNLYGF